MKEYPESHIEAFITQENEFTFPLKGDIGIQISDDGRIWICINGIAFLRATPHINKRMSK